MTKTKHTKVITEEDKFPFILQTRIIHLRDTKNDHQYTTRHSSFNPDAQLNSACAGKTEVRNKNHKIKMELEITFHHLHCSLPEKSTKEASL